MMRKPVNENQALNRLLLKKEIEFEQITPYMGGGPYGYTWECKDTGGGKFNPEKYVGGPTANTIIGKMRYVASLAVASFVKDLSNGYRSVYKYGNEVTRIRNLGFLEAIFGSINPAFKAIVKVTVQVNEATAKPVWSFIKERRSPTRYGMIARKNFLERCKHCPAIGIEPKVIISINKKMTENAGLDDATKELMDITEKTLIATMSIWGIGKAANRGFGRFKPKNTSLPSPCGKNGYISQLLESYKKVFEKIGLPTGLYNDISKVPRLSTVINKPNLCMSKSMYSHSSAKDVLDKIAHSVTKMQWRRSVRDASMLHTFPLGLPRHAKAPYQEKVYTGYLMIKDANIESEPVPVKKWVKAYLELVDTGFRRQSYVLISARRDSGNWHIDIIGLPSLDIQEILNGIKKSEIVGKEKSVYRLFHVGYKDYYIRLRRLRDIISESTENLVRIAVRHVYDSII